MRSVWAVVFAVMLGLWGGAAGAELPSEVGRWSPLMSWPISATHAHLLPTGKVMIYGEFEEGAQPPRLWDPETNTLTELPTPHHNIFCTGHSYLADGRLLLTGGHEYAHVGVPHTLAFDPFTYTWTSLPDMNNNRWYPTNTTLPNGDVMVLSGETDGPGTSNTLGQRWLSAIGAWRDMTTAVRDLPYYPRMFLAPNGKLFFAGPWRTNRWMDPEGTGVWFESSRSLYGGRAYGGAVYFDGKVLLVGGGDPPTDTVELIDLTQPSLEWTYRAPMSVARRQHNTTLLPDGTVLVTGGSSASGFNNIAGAVFHAEAWNPETNQWSQLASGSAFRGYHSTSLLLPDGRVLSAGGRLVRTAEVFEPPYLFKGPRPTITSAPDLIQPGTSFFVETPDVAQIQKVTLIALGSVTHAFDQNQRLLTLPHAMADGGLVVSAPASNLLAPPGPYMLFLVNSDGVPSVAKMVSVQTVPLGSTRTIVFSDVWKYDDSNVDRGTDWIYASYDDSEWKSGPGRLGYGSADDSTVLTRTNPSQPSVYFRKKFTLDKPVSAARLEVLFDDGVQVWINGTPVFSRNMGNGLAFGVYASATTSNEYRRENLSLANNPFLVGENIVTAMVKQMGGGSDDLTFALGLELEFSDEPVPDTLVLQTPNGGERLQPGAVIPIRWVSNGNVATVDLEYSTDQGATWTPIASGLPVYPSAYSWTVPDVTTSQALVRISRGSGGLSDESNAPFTISHEVRQQVIAWGDSWRYEDSGLDPGPGWNTLGFDDTAWKEGVGQFGYGDGDEATVLPRSNPVQASVYFRKKLTLSGPVTSATLRALFDDGVVVFVNGTPVFTRNVADPAHAKYATASVEDSVDTAELSLSPNPFVPGENVIGVMVKQVGKTSPDLSFDLALEVGITPAAP